MYDANLVFKAAQWLEYKLLVKYIRCLESLSG